LIAPCCRMDCRVRGERSDAVLRTAMPGNDEGRKKETIEGSGTPTDAVFRVRTSGCGARHGEIGLRRPAAAGALACRRSTDGSSLGTRRRQGAASGHASWDVAERRSCSHPHSWGSTDTVSAGVTRPRPVPVQRAPRSLVCSARRLMPKAARVRVVTPPAGTALAPAFRSTSRRRPS
jgi:hypothetical protein